MTTVTVLTTFHNAERTILESANSVLHQSFKDFELLMIDDGSTDSSSTIINNLDDNRVRLFSPGRLGRAAALNFGLNNAKGKYIAILDSDDIAFPDRLEKQLHYITKYSLSLVASNAVLSDDQGHYIGNTNFPASHELITESLFNLNVFPHSSVMFRKESVMKFGGYNERCEKSIDLNMYLDLIKENETFYMMKERLIYLNISSTSWGPLCSGTKSLIKKI